MDRGVMTQGAIMNEGGGNCEGNTEMRPLVYRDSLRQEQAKQM